MPRPKKPKEEPKKQSELNRLLSDIRRDITLIPDLIKILEGIPIKYDTDRNKDFCKSYMISLFQKYIEDLNDREMMLAACGLLRGYKFREQELDKRLTDYREYAQGRNPWIKISWAASTYATKCRGKLGEIVCQLESDLTNRMGENNGKLGIFDKTPDKPIYPEPRYAPKESLEGENPDKKPWRKKHLIILCSIAIVIVVIIAAFLIWRWHDKHSLEARDTGAETIEEMPKYEPQNRIVNMDEPDEYDVEAFFDGLIEFIIRSPLYGDMVAQGLSDLDEAFTNPNPWLTEFIEKTDAAMELPPTQHPRGMEYWMEYRKGESNNLFTTDEYFLYAAHLAELVKKFTIVGLREWEYSASWEIPRFFLSSSDRAQKSTEKMTQPALIMEYINKKTGKVQFIIGFSLEDGHLLIYDPEIAQ